MPIITQAESGQIDAVGVMMHAGLPGFAAARRFSLLSWGDAGGPFLLLRSLDIDGLEFVVVPPERFFPNYHAPIDPLTAQRLSLSHLDVPLILVILTVGSPAGAPTANLLGPIVVNQRTMAAAQLFLHGSEDLLHALLIDPRS